MIPYTTLQKFGLIRLFRLDTNRDGRMKQLRSIRFINRGILLKNIQKCFKELLHDDVSQFARKI